MLRELKFYFKSNKKFIISIYIQILIIMLLVGSLLYFFYSIDSTESGFKEIYDGKAIFKLSDNYYFEKEDEFKKNQDTVAVKKDFYNMLNNTKDFNYLTSKEHFIKVNNDKIPQKFIEDNTMYNEDKKYKIIKSYQINKNAFDFFNIEIENGIIKDEYFEYNGYIPIFLGSSYNDIFKINEEIDIKYFEYEFKGKVVGFLKENSIVLGNGNIDIKLDDYIVLPHIDFKDPITDEERTFQDVVYFMMLEGYLVTEDNELDIKNMKDTVEVMSQQSGYLEYIFLGQNSHIKSYYNTISILSNNKVLVYTLICLIVVINIIIISIVFWIKNKKRISYFSTHFLFGSTKKQLFKQQFLEIELIFMFAFVSYYIINDKIFKLYDIKIYFIILVFTNILTIILTIILSKAVINKSITNGLNYNEN